jgi:hypothetical protein
MRRSARIAVALCVGFTAGAARGQATPTALRLGDLQVGAGFAFAQSINTQAIPSTRLSLSGAFTYVVFDVREHFGVEANLRQLTDTDGSHISQRTYDIGGRYVRHYGNNLLNPYLKVLVGRGIYNYPHNVAKLAYNVYTGGGGVDVSVKSFFNVRLDYEYQTWLSFPRGDLHPGALSIGIAYHLPADCRDHPCAR